MSSLRSPLCTKSVKLAVIFPSSLLLSLVPHLPLSVPSLALPFSSFPFRVSFFVGVFDLLIPCFTQLYIFSWRECWLRLERGRGVG